MNGIHGIVGLGEFVGGLRAALDSAYKLGIRRHTASRFEQYLALLEEAASFRYPMPFPWQGNPERRRLFFEAASQAQQLLDAAKIWPTIDLNVAERKLGKIFDGDPLPPRNTAVEDGPRNTLFEFAAAHSLQSKGFNVNLTADREDVFAIDDDLGGFAVECKRPASSRALAKNVKKLRRQLRERCRARDCLGIAILGVERMLGLGGATPSVANFEALRTSINGTLTAEVRRVQTAEREGGKPFFPTTPLGGVLLTSAVFLEDRGGIFTVSEMGIFLTGPNDHPLSERIYRSLSRRIETAPAIALRPI